MISRHSVINGIRMAIMWFVSVVLMISAIGSMWLPAIDHKDLAVVCLKQLKSQ